MSDSFDRKQSEQPAAPYSPYAQAPPSQFPVFSTFGDSKPNDNSYGNLNVS